MNIPFEEKKAEAIRRMETLGIHPMAIEQFKQENLVNLSEGKTGAFFWADKNEKAHIAEFEKQLNCLVYTGIRSVSNIGHTEEYLYVSDDKEDWPFERKLLQEKQPIAYVYNNDMPDCSESGSIGIEITEAEGLIRTW